MLSNQIYFYKFFFVRYSFLRISLTALFMIVYGFLPTAYADNVVCSLSSGDATMTLKKADSGQYAVAFNFMGTDINPESANNPTLVLDAKYKTFYLTYTDFSIDGDCMTLTSRQTLSPSSIEIEVTDRFTAIGDGGFSMHRELKVLSLGSNPYKDGFYTSFGLQLAEQDELLDYDYFIPSVWYKSQFETEANMPTNCPKATDTNFFYRDDRLTVPVIMMRNKATGLTVEILDDNSPSATTLADSRGEEISADYLFGGVGVVKRKNMGCFTPIATWPGCDLRTGGLGCRRHPFTTELKSHTYDVFFRFLHTDTYQQAFYDAWQIGVERYAAEIRQVDLKYAYDALISTLDYYYLSPTGSNESNYYVKVHRAGFPWGVYLNRNETNATTYEIGFVGAQLQAAYALLRAGIERGNASLRSHGINVLNFWASEGLSELGFPRSRYYSILGQWDSSAMTSIRQASTGMSALLEAWCYYKKRGTDRQSWLNACKKFGKWLIDNQNDDGSFYMEYNPFAISSGKHPAGKQNKLLTVCVVRYLVEMYITTEDSLYLQAAMRAADFAYAKQHEQWLYAASVIDNPQLLDSESGQQALNSFLALYDLTSDRKWLDAAEQAAFYCCSFTYMHEVPVETDQTVATDWPRDRSIVGQHFITAASNSAADLGFAWSSFALYRLYLYTGRKVFLTMARVSAHNTKQSMNLYQSLYPNKQEGLQQEAFTPRTASGCSRRMNSVMEALTWNYAAHLEPMMRFADAFGTVDLEDVERMDEATKQQLNLHYAALQSCDYGQTPLSIPKQPINIALPHIKLSKDGIHLTSNFGNFQHIEICDTSGMIVAERGNINDKTVILPFRIGTKAPLIFTIEYTSGIISRFKYLLTI